MLNPVEVNSKYSHISVVRSPINAKYIFDSHTERTHRIQKVIEKDSIYYAKITPEFYAPISKTPRSKNRWYFVQ